MEKHLEDLVVREHSNACFQFKLKNETPSRSEWFKNGIRIESTERVSFSTVGDGHLLEINSATIEDYGVYTVIVDDLRNGKKYHSSSVLYIVPSPKEYSSILTSSNFSNINIVKHLLPVTVRTENPIELFVEIKSSLAVIFTWFKCNNRLLNNDRIGIISNTNSSTLLIKKANNSDTGIYFVIIETENSLASSFAKIIVLPKDISEYKSDIAPVIEEQLPSEIEVNAYEELKLNCKVKIKLHHKIKWYKNGLPIVSDHNNLIPEYYANQYIGLRIPCIRETAEFSVVICDMTTNKTVASRCMVKVNARTVSDAAFAEILKQLNSVVSFVGAQTSFSCKFDVQNIKYNYVVWHVGIFRVQRTNSRFKVICKGGEFQLIVKQLEPEMAGEVICEIRKADFNGDHILVGTAKSKLILVPSFYCKLNVNQKRVGWITRSTKHIPNDLLLEVECYRYKDGTIYCGLSTVEDHSIQAIPINTIHKNNNELDHINTSIELKWQSVSCDAIIYWFSVDLKLPNSEYIEAGITSTPSIEIIDLPIEKSMEFRIKAIEPKEGTIENLRFRPEPNTTIMKDYNLEPIEIFYNKYINIGRTIGRGAFGCVVLVQNNGEYFAAKILKTRTKKKINNAIREFEVMKQLNHPKLINLVEAFVAKDSLVLVMEYIWGGELFNRIVEENHIRELDVVSYVRQICEALLYLHSNKILHLDLKPENIVCLSPNSTQIKIIDFGLARILDAKKLMYGMYGTREYLSPEVLNYEPLSTACDMWSFGVVIYVMLSGVQPFAGDTDLEQSANITKGVYSYEDDAFSEISDLAKDFIDHLLVLPGGERMSAAAALKHQWLTDGPPKGRSYGPMKRAVKNLKNYLAKYKARWLRAGNVMIAARRLGIHAQKNARSILSAEENSSYNKMNTIVAAPS